MIQAENLVLQEALGLELAGFTISFTVPEVEAVLTVSVDGFSRNRSSSVSISMTMTLSVIGFGVISVLAVVSLGSQESSGFRGGEEGKEDDQEAEDSFHF